jgi:hypothetical protein
MAAGAGTLSRGLTLRLATGLALVSVATVLVASIWTADRGPEPDSGAGPVLVRVGVVEGQSVPGYLRSSQGELAALLRGSAAAPDTPMWALVSLTAYVPPDRLMSVFGGVAVAQVYARAPVPGTMTQVVRIQVYRMPDDVVSGMLGAAAGRDRERADYQHLGDALGSSDDQIRLRQAYASAARTAAQEAAAYRARCSCVFAAVVRAAPTALDGIAGHAEVRAVDPAPEVRRLDRTEFRPPLPEVWTTMPGDPRTTTMPSSLAASRVASGTPTPLPSSTGANVTSAPSVDPGTGSVPSAPAWEERAAVPSAPAQSLAPAVSTASAGAPGR